MNLNVTLEFACYTQYGVYMYIFIYAKASGPTITPKKSKVCLIIIFTPQKTITQHYHTLR